METDEPIVTGTGDAAQLSNDFLSSARVFAWSVREVIERSVLREVAGDKLTFSQLKLLYLVAHTDTLNIGDAASFLGVTCGAASRAVDKLVHRRRFCAVWLRPRTAALSGSRSPKPAAN